MDRKLKGLLLAAVLLVSAAPARSQDPLPRSRPEDSGVSGSGLREAAALLESYVTEGRIAGAVAALARDGALVWLESVGVQDLEARTPMSDRSLFRIYSMTKSVTAVAVMMLQEEGRFSLDDPVYRYLPAFEQVRVVSEPDAQPRPPARPITVRDLLLHTSGLSHRTSDLYRELRVRSRGDSLDQFIAKVVRAPLLEDPGTRFRYSAAITVLGRLVEIWSGLPLDTFMSERIFRPLRMADTGFWVGPEQRARLATVYGPGPDGALTPVQIEDVPFTERPALLEGAVGLVSSVPDYLRFSQMLLNGGELDGVRLLQAATVARMTSNGLSSSVLEARRGGTMGWGLANVNVVLDASGLGYPANADEYGWDGTAGTIFWIDPTTRTVILLMTQSSPSNPDMLRQRFKALIQQALPAPSGG